MAEPILCQVGYMQKVIDRVRQLNLKEGLASDPEVQLLEDALCLVFLEFEFADFCQRKEYETVMRILKKTWNKMSDRARKEAGTLPLNDRQQALLQEALKQDSTQTQ